jgi:hypothetical protein
MNGVTNILINNDVMPVYHIIDMAREIHPDRQKLQSKGFSLSRLSLYLISLTIGSISAIIIDANTDMSML